MLPHMHAATEIAVHEVFTKIVVIIGAQIMKAHLQLFSSKGTSIRYLLVQAQ